jgi:transposase-like protein
MATGRMARNAFVGKLLAAQGGDVRREGMRVLAQALMEGEGAGLIGAERHERTRDRAGYRNGSRLRTWDTRGGTLELASPKMRPGRDGPSLLEPRRRVARARRAGGQAASVPGVSTRTGDDLRNALGLDGLSQSEVARLWTARDTEVEACRRRPLTGEPPSRWLEATSPRSARMAGGSAWRPSSRSAAPPTASGRGSVGTRGRRTMPAPPRDARPARRAARDRRCARRAQAGPRPRA